VKQLEAVIDFTMPTLKGLHFKLTQHAVFGEDTRPRLSLGRYPHLPKSGATICNAAFKRLLSSFFATSCIFIKKILKMKKLYLLVVIVFCSSYCFSQSRLTTAEFQKVMEPATEIEVPFAEKTVMKTIVDMMEKKGYKGKDTRGYYTFKGVVLPELGTNSYDLYFKTERKSRKEKDNTILTLLVSGGYEKFIGDSAGSALMANVKMFLNKQIDASAAYDLEMQITEQDEITQNAQKKYTSLTEDGVNLQKKKEKLEKEIQENIKKQADQKTEAEKQAQIFNMLRGKRKQ